MCSMTKVAGAFMLVIETYKTINMTCQAVTIIDKITYTFSIYHTSE